MGPYYWNKERICAEERKDIPIIKGEKKRGMQIYSRIIEKEIYQIF